MTPAPITPTPEQVEAHEDLRLSIEELSHSAYSHGFLVGKGLDAAETEHLLNTAKAGVAEALTAALNLPTSSPDASLQRQIAEARAEAFEEAALVAVMLRCEADNSDCRMDAALEIEQCIRARASAERSTASQEEDSNGQERRPADHLGMDCNAVEIHVEQKKSCSPARRFTQGAGLT